MTRIFRGVTLEKDGALFVIVFAENGRQRTADCESMNDKINANQKS